MPASLVGASEVPLEPAKALLYSLWCHTPAHLQYERKNCRPYARKLAADGEGALKCPRHLVSNLDRM